MTSIPTHTVSVGDTSLAVHTSGSGLPLVLLHAFPLDHTLFAGQLPLADHLRLILPDLRGFGGSGGPERTAVPESIERLADDLAALLEALHIDEPAVIGGVSMGGYVAQHVATRHPEKVRAVILADTKLEADTVEARAARVDLAAKVGRVGQRILAEAMLPRLIAQGSTACVATRRAEVEQALLTTIQRQPVATIQAALAALGSRPDMTEPMRHFRGPVLLVCGEHDVITPPAVMAAMEEILPQPRLLVVPGAGHLTPLETPEVFNRAVLEFLGFDLPEASATRARRGAEAGGQV